MIIYNTTANKLEKVKEKPFKLESEIQSIFERAYEYVVNGKSH